VLGALDRARDSGEGSDGTDQSGQMVKNFDNMFGNVDGIISGGYYNHPWNHILHEPHLEAGLPNLINRPLTNSLAKARQMVATAKKHGATILELSAFEQNDEKNR